MDDFAEKFLPSPNKTTKKRKVDKDGFVCPATPDAPKSSGQFEAFNTVWDDFNEEDGATVSGYFRTDTEQTGSHPRGQGAAEQYLDGQSLMENLTNEFTKDAADLLKEWGKVYKQCEEYETGCPRKLDLLIHEARSLEESLNSQKSVLCHRLKGIGQTLQLE